MRSAARPGRCVLRFRAAATLRAMVAACGLGLLAVGPMPAVAAETSPVAMAAARGGSCGMRAPTDTRPRIGLALGGGGARGIAHISILRELERLHVPVDCIAGTSMGALAGGLYASGMSVDELEALVRSTDWPRLFDDSLERPERSWRRKQDDRDRLATLGVGITGTGVRTSPGLLQGERILAMFEHNTLAVSAIDDFDRLPIPYRAVATDLNTGEAVVLDHGSLAMAMRASMSIPGVFQPAEVDGRILLDGGLADQVPIDVVRAMGADVVIAVDVGTPLAALDRDASLLQVVGQMSGMMTVGNTRRALATLTPADVLIVPALGDAVATKDFAKADAALAIGARAADAAGPALARHAVPEAQWLAARGAQTRPATPPPVVAFVRLDNQTEYADAMLLDELRIPTGVPLDAEAIEKRLLRVYGRGTLSSITYEVVEEGGRSGVLVRARPKSHGPNYVQVGLDASTDFAGAFEGTLRAALLVAPISPLGAEARLTVGVGSEPELKAEYYRPLDTANDYVFYAQAGYFNPNIHVFDTAGNDLAQYDVQLLGGELRFSREFGNYGAATLGLRRGHGRADVEIGDPALPGYDFDQGSLYAEATVDRLDSLYFPRDGYFASLGYTIEREWLGSDDTFDHVDLDVVAARSFGKHGLQLGARYHATTSGTLPVQSLYRLGGLTQLAGFRRNELTGQAYALVFGGYTYQLARFFGRSALLGATLEYGNAWQRRSDMRWNDGILNAGLYVGFDSWLGPMLFGYGWREGGDGTLFLEIGRPF